MSRAQVCAWMSALGLLLPVVAAGQDRTEREVVDLIIRDGPQARAIRAEVDVIRREQDARLVYPNPAVTYSRESAGFTEFLQAEQALPIFGTRGALSRAGAAAATAAEGARDSRLWALRSDAGAAAARLVAEQQRLELARAHVADVQRLVEILRTREREGEGSRFDRMRAEQELRDFGQIETAAAVSVAEAKAILLGMLPRDVALTRILPTDATTGALESTESLIARAGNARAELRAIRQLRDRTTFEADAARRARLPSPTVFGGVKRADDGPERQTGAVFGLSVAVPLFDSGSREAAKWEAEGVRADAELAAIEDQVRAEIAGASDVLRWRQAAVSSDRPDAAEELVQIATVAYREGEVGILELLDAVRTAARAANRTIDQRLGVRLAQIALERAVGETLWP